MPSSRSSRLIALGALAALVATAACTYPPLTIRPPDAAADVVASDLGDAPSDTADDVVRADGDAGDATADAGPRVCPWMLQRMLNIPDRVEMMTLPTMSLNAASTCSTPPMMDTTYGEQVYPLRIAARRGVTIAISNRTAPLDGGTTPPSIPFIMLRDACDDVMTERACLPAPATGARELRVILEPGLYYIVVDGQPTGAGGPTTPPTYTLTIDDFPMPAPNAGCDQARVLTTDMPLTGQSTAGGALRGVACGSLLGARVYYRLTIPPGQRVRVAAAPVMTTGTEAVTVQLTSDCVAADCLSAGASGGGMPATASADNPGETPRDIIVAVANTSTTAPDVQFSLSASVAPIPYRETSITAQCEDVFGAGTTALMPAYPLFAAPPPMPPMPPPNWIDDSSSGIVSLPFSFSLFGNALGFFSAESNGLMQLWPAPSGMPSLAYYNLAFPSPLAPLNAVAPFWDDLEPIISGGVTTATIRTGTLGTAPMRRFVVQWDNFRFLGDPGAAMRFQVKLFETTNVVEFHYCRLERVVIPDASSPSTPGRLYGNSATIGLQNRDGSDGVMHSFNRDDAVSTATAIRFTPH